MEILTNVIISKNSSPNSIENRTKCNSNDYRYRMATLRSHFNFFVKVSIGIL